MFGKKVVVAFIIVGVVIASLGCVSFNFGDFDVDRVEVGELQRQTKIVERGADDEVRTRVQLGAGELKIEGGAPADALMEADFVYNVADWEPEVEYEAGRLMVKQPRIEKFPFNDDVRYEWDLTFNDDVPMDLRVEFGAGEADIDVSSLSVTSLDLKLGAGDMMVDAHDNTTLERMEFDMGAGDIDLDLRGAWSDDVDVMVQGGVGRATLRLPEEGIGVRVDVTKGIGGLEAEGFRILDGAYVNDAYETADVVIYVNIQAGIGQIKLILD